MFSGMNVTLKSSTDTSQLYGQETHLELLILQSRELLEDKKSLFPYICTL